MEELQRLFVVRLTQFRAARVLCQICCYFEEVSAENASAAN
jgi:hypothetical protein